MVITWNSFLIYFTTIEKPYKLSKLAWNGAINTECSAKISVVAHQPERDNSKCLYVEMFGNFLFFFLRKQK